MTRAQLLELGFSRKAIEHRLARGRLHSLRRGVYAVGRPQLTRYGQWLAAVLSCGPRAVLSHASAAALWELTPGNHRQPEVSIPRSADHRPSGVRVHRTLLEPGDVTKHHGIPVTTSVRTLIDIATRLSSSRLEATINEADKLGLTDPETLRAKISAYPTQPGVGALRRILDHRTFVLTDSELERRFLPIARQAGLPLPQTGRRVNGYKVDFFWPDIALVVETDGLRYHRTPAQQAKDRLRDQTHVAAGLTCLRFTRAQVRFEPDHVHATLAAVVRVATARQPKAAQSAED